MRYADAGYKTQLVLGVRDLSNQFFCEGAAIWERSVEVWWLNAWEWGEGCGLGLLPVMRIAYLARLVSHVASYCDVPPVSLLVFFACVRHVSCPYGSVLPTVCIFCLFVVGPVPPTFLSRPLHQGFTGEE